jgi:hypothetical protein
VHFACEEDVSLRGPGKNAVVRLCALKTPVLKPNHPQGPIGGGAFGG